MHQLITNNCCGLRWLLIAVWLPALADTIELDDYYLNNNEITYISPTRLKQTPHDIPASVSRITQETILKLQLNSLPEVFRYVAGMTGTRLFLYQYSVDYHISDANAPSRLLLLIDGITVDRPFYSSNSWSTLPISINDIDYIEVTRSPGAATYGISALTAVINIVTKDPLSSPAFSANATTSGNDYRRLDMSFSGQPSAGFSYRISASANNDNGFDGNYYSTEELENLRRRLERLQRFEEQKESHDNSKTRLINSTVNLKISQSTDASLSFYHNSGSFEEPKERESYFLLNLNDDKAKLKSNYFSGRIKHVLSDHHDFTVKAYHTRVKHTLDYSLNAPSVFFSQPLAQLSFLNIEYAIALLENGNLSDVPHIGSPEEEALRAQFEEEHYNYTDEIYGTLTTGAYDYNYLEKYTTVEFEDTYIFNENMRLISGFGASQQDIDFVTYYQENMSSNTYRLFTNAETRWNKWVFNSGGMLEYNDKVSIKPAFSPRLGANYRLNNDSTLRFILSKAVQIPELSESEFNPRFYVKNLTPAYPVDQRTEGYMAFTRSKLNGNLAAEKLLAREISLYTKKTYPYGHGTIDVNSDVKLFYNSLHFRPHIYFGDFKKTTNARLKGFETDTNILFSRLLSDRLDSIDLHINYTYLDSELGNFFSENAFFSIERQNNIQNEKFIQHTGSVYSIFNLKDGWFTSLSYSENGTKTSNFSTYEFGFGREIKLATGSFIFSGKLSHQNRPDDFPMNDSPNTFFFNAKFQL